jgi:hypothetical protein
LGHLQFLVGALPGSVVDFRLEVFDSPPQQSGSCSYPALPISEASPPRRDLAGACDVEAGFSRADFAAIDFLEFRGKTKVAALKGASTKGQML